MPTQSSRAIDTRRVLGQAPSLESAKTLKSKRVVGITEISTRIVIKQHRSDMGAGVPPSYGASSNSLPGEYLHGEDTGGTVIVCDPSMTGPLIQTEFFDDTDDGIAGNAWNDDNTAGNTALRANLCAAASDFTLDGQAQIRNYPYTYISSPPDLHGPDLPYRADGLCVMGMGFVGARLRFFQIPGSCIRLYQCSTNGGGQAGAFGIYDAPPPALYSIWMESAMYGCVNNSGDTTLFDLQGGGFVKDGIVMNGSGSRLIDSHIDGADRSLVCTLPCEIRDCYMEAARIGTDVEGTAYNTQISGMNIGPGTCTYRGVRIGAHGTMMSGLFGTVGGGSDVAGAEVLTGIVHWKCWGSLSLSGTTSKGLIQRGSRGSTDLGGGWNTTLSSAVMVSVAENTFGCESTVRAAISGGCLFDLSATTLNSVNGKGNVYNALCDLSNGAVAFKYPTGSNTFNLAPGNKVVLNGAVTYRNGLGDLYIDGVKQ